MSAVSSSRSYTLAAGEDTLYLTGSGNIDGAGDNLNNKLIGNSGANILYGYDGHDSLYGGSGGDTLYGGIGNDILDGQAGADLMIGELGNDYYVVDSLADIVVEQAGEGTDTVRSALASYVLPDNLESLVLSSGVAISGAGNSLNNALTGNSLNNLLQGLDGADTLYGGAGNDTLEGGNGNDTLDGQAGDDLMSGGNGNDSYGVDSLNDTIVEAAGEGVDTLYFHLASDVDALYMTGYVVPDNVENVIINSAFSSPYMELIGSNANNLLKDLTPTGISIIHGMGGNDTIYGGSSTYAANNYQELYGDDGNDTIYAYGADSVLGGSGNDVLISMQGANILWGGSGDDTYIMYQGALSSAGELANEGHDTIKSYGSYSLENWEIEDLTLMETTYFTEGTGNHLNNVLQGSSASNRLYGMEGNDTLIGWGGDDELQGGPGDDLIKIGVDSLTAPAWGGMQWVYGNEGHDTFWIGNNYRGNHAIYNTSGVDSLVINDFTSGEDHIRLALSPTAANPTTVNQVFTRLLGAPLQTTADWDALLSLASASGSAAAPTLTAIRYDEDPAWQYVTYLVLDRSDSATFTSDDLCIYISGGMDFQVSDFIFDHM